MKGSEHLYWLMAMAGLAVTVPFAMGLVVLAKTGTSPTGIFFEHVPGGALGLVAMLGGALVAKAAVTSTDMPLKLRLVMGGAWAIQFFCMIGALPIYMLASAQGKTLMKTVTWLVEAETEGVLTWVLYTSIIVGTEITVPALLIAVGYESGQAVERAERVELARTDVRSGTSEDHVLVELGHGPATASELIKRGTWRGSTIDGKLRDLVTDGRVKVVAGSSPREYTLGTS